MQQADSTAVSSERSELYGYVLTDTVTEFYGHITHGDGGPDFFELHALCGSRGAEKEVTSGL